MTDEMNAWIDTFRRLRMQCDWPALVEHIRANVNLSKEVLLSTDPEVQSMCHVTYVGTHKN